MDQNLCPFCQGELTFNTSNNKGSEQYQCHACQHIYTRVAKCPDCQQAADKIQACGSVSYFCSHCNELKSKSRIQFEYHDAL